MTTDISIVIPVFNEEDNLKELLDRCLDACNKMDRSFEIILVDDGSTDRSAEIIARMARENSGKVTGVFFNRNYGQHAAVTAGFKESKGDTVITLDADLQNPPEEIPKLVEQIDRGYDVVGSIRTPREDSLFRRAASNLVNKTVQKSTGVMMNDYGCMLRAYRRPIVDAVLQCHERSSFIPVLANRFARNTTEIQVRHARRGAGESKYSVWKLINLQFDLLTSMTTFPLRLLSFLGIFISGTGFAIGAYIIVMRLFHGSDWAVGGVFTLFAILFIFIGALFVGMGLLGEYIGRVYDDVRARPRFFIHQVIGRQQSKE